MLHNKTLLICLGLSGISSARADKQITAEVLTDKNAAEDAGRWVSRLWPKEALEPIRSLDSQIRAFHYQKTLPWMDKGERIIAARTFTPYMDEMRNMRYKRETLVQGFLDHYEDWIQAARLMRGDTFREDEYPHVSDARKKFKFELSSMPVPHREDFRVTLANEEMDEVQRSLDARIQRAERNATVDLYRRMAAPVVALVERLANPDAKITDATLNALKELVNSLPDINIMDDPEVESIRQSIRDQLCRIYPDAVNDSRSDRQRSLTKANAILNKMAPWLDPVEDEDAA